MSISSRDIAVGDTVLFKESDRNCYGVVMDAFNYTSHADHPVIVNNHTTNRITFVPLANLTICSECECRYCHKIYNTKEKMNACETSCKDKIDSCGFHKGDKVMCHMPDDRYYSAVIDSLNIHYVADGEHPYVVATITRNKDNLKISTDISYLCHTVDDYPEAGDLVMISNLCSSSKFVGYGILCPVHDDISLTPNTECSILLIDPSTGLKADVIHVRYGFLNVIRKRKDMDKALYCCSKIIDNFGFDEKNYEIAIDVNGKLRVVYKSPLF